MLPTEWTKPPWTSCAAIIGAGQRPRIAQRARACRDPRARSPHSARGSARPQRAFGRWRQSRRRRTQAACRLVREVADRGRAAQLGRESVRGRTAASPQPRYALVQDEGVRPWMFRSYCASSRRHFVVRRPSVPEWGRQFRFVRVHHEHREELGRLRLAGIGADAVAVAGQLGETLSDLVGRHRSVVDLTADCPLEHRRVDEGGFEMRVARRVAARAVFDEHTLDALAGNVRKLVLVDEGHLGVLRLRRIGEAAAEWQGGDKQRTEDAFLGVVSFGWLLLGQALACWRRSPSSKPMRPRRASPNGTSERSSTRPPKYRASGSLTTVRGSPTAFR